jgi:hypothetical protein
MATVTRARKRTHWNADEVSRSGMDWAELMIKVGFISFGPRATHAIRLTPNTFAVCYDNDQTFAVVVEEIDMEED